MILEIHGGPFASYGPVFASELQLYAAAGYVVVYPNPRGSTSYGFDFADQINDNRVREAAATGDCARARGIDTVVGTLRPGGAADVIAVPGNPADDLRRLEDVRMVMQGGIVRR